jgi:hypothetical protein
LQGVGGIITYDEYWSRLNQEQKDQILHLNNGQRAADKKYIQEKITVDVGKEFEVEVGKEFVVVLKPESSKDGEFANMSCTDFSSDSGRCGESVRGDRSE